MTSHTTDEETMDRQPFSTDEAPPASGASAGGSLSRAVRVGVYLRDLADFDEMDAAYREHFDAPLPARTTIQSDLVGFDVEIDAVVLVDD